ncbi:hypothetical protein I4641_13420 [Waterburya agarophytonicola K14]|uniref:Uncharacterized protein n=1 Tax=Waterburya agarophytonicola KI4 TaxID=2874699 RepID=A0A964BQV9_9CYAN|nr:hypothetical protein [Waterburya agarophytonicola]MCC0177978.1 hypothetical protein [Waterburya agarophytonicola KI4]
MNNKKKYYFWLVASIIVAILFSFSGFGLAFDSPYTIQDDARQHVFWLQRLSDRDLFTGDLIADYFSSVVPNGYKFVYWLANVVGIKPFLFNKLLPLFLGVGTSIFAFLITLEIFPIPLAGFFASLLLNQNLWMLDDLVSGTPRAFFWVLFLGFIYYLLRQNLLFCSLFIALQGLFYPQVLLISAGILSLNLITQKQKRYFYIIGLIVAIAVMAMYKLQTADSHEVISLELAKQLPEFYEGGRNTFFLDNFFSFWLIGQRSGYFPREWQYLLLCSFGLLLPFLLKSPKNFPTVRYIKPQMEIIGTILVASLSLFCLSHLLLFKLHLPSRYTQNTWRIVIAIADGITLTIIIDKISQYQKKMRPFIIIIIITALLYPTYAVQSYPYRLGYVTGEVPELYQFLEQQPKDILIASLSKEADFIPSLAKRSVLVSEEYSIPYHWDYYQQIRQRAKDLIQAQYSSSQAEIEHFIKQYKIDLWLLDKDTFNSEYLSKNSWLNQFQPETKNAIAKLQDNNKFILNNKSDRCSVFQTAKLNLLDARCLISVQTH